MTDGPFGSNLKSAHYVETGPRVIRLQNIGFGHFIDTRAHIAEEHFETLRTHEVVGGDLVVASLGEDLPRACLIPNGVGPAIVKADCIRVRLHPGIDSRYVNYAMQRPALRRSVRDQVHGVGRPRLGMGGIRELALPLPPLAEQERIVAAIEENLSRLDAAEASLASAIRRIGVLGSGVLDDVWHADGPTVHLEDVLAQPLANGRSVTTDPKGFPVLRLTALKERRILLSERKGGSWTSQQAEPFLVRRNDFLVSRGNGSLSLVGRGGLVEEEPDAVAYPDTLIRVRVRLDEYDPRFLRLAWDSTRTRRHLERQARTTAGIYKVNQDMLRVVPIPKPPLEDQRRAVARIESALAATARLRRDVSAGLLRSTALRRSILAAAFSGQLVPQDAADEPASVLLQRIRAERDAQPRTGRARKVTA